MRHAGPASGKTSGRRGTGQAGDDQRAGQVGRGGRTGNAGSGLRGTRVTGLSAYWLVLAGTAAALAIMREGVHFLRSGTLVLAGFLLVAGTVRLVLPERQAGMLSSRRRWIDVAILTTLGIGLLIAGIVVPTPG